MSDKLVIKDNSTDNNLLQLKIQSREKLLFEGVVESVTSVNDKGEFDVLAHHTHFICIIHDKLEYKLTSGKNVELKLDSGVMRVHNEGIEVYVGF